MADHRRSPRMQARFWIQVRGVDIGPVLRRGDVSLSGIFFETDQEVGEPGSVQHLVVSPYSKHPTVEVMARVIRVVSLNDIWRGPGISGVGMEFMAEDADRRQAIQHFVQGLAGTRSDQAPAVDVELYDATPGMRLKRLSLKGMTLITTWPVTVGETLRCEVQAPASGRRLRITGKATATQPLAEDRYQVEVKFREDKPSRPSWDDVPVEGVSLDDAMSVLLEETTAPGPEDSRRHDLTGALDRIQLAALLSFLEMERMTGTLTLHREDASAHVWVKDGRVLDVTSDNLAGAPMNLLSKMLTWQEGAFHFYVRDITVADKLNSSTTGLLMELARLDDEARR